MYIVDCWQNTPHAVYLRVIPVDLRDQQKHRREEKREGEGGDERVRGEVDCLERSEVVP